MRYDILQQCVRQQQPFAGLALYDAALAQQAEQANIDFCLVGDSLAQVFAGKNSTVHATIEQMAYHTMAVSQGAPNTYLMADLPYLSAGCLSDAIQSARTLMQAGAHCLKMELTPAQLPIFHQLADLGVPLCAHLGLTPQMVHQLGGYRVQGSQPEGAKKLIQFAKEAEESGAICLLLECVSASVVSDIIPAASVPVIGIGAGSATHGQILVASDVLGMTPKAPRFAKNFLAEQGSIAKAFGAFRSAVLEKQFPTAEHAWD
jgi:3-methyl-2-oxobutanoate hydroxymethyltransferase